MALVLGAISLGALVTPVLIDVADLDTTLLVLGLAIPVSAALPWTAALDRQRARRLAVLRPRVETLEGLGVFADASRATPERLASSSVEVLEPDPRRDVVVEGEPASALYVLLDGEVEVFARGEAEQTRHIRTTRAPACFGEIRPALTGAAHGRRADNDAVPARAHRRRCVPRRADRSGAGHGADVPRADTMPAV